jgi:hypothetical protein
VASANAVGLNRLGRPALRRLGDGPTRGGQSPAVRGQFRLPLTAIGLSSLMSQLDTATVREWRAGLLEAGVSSTMVAKSYRLLRAICCARS